MSDPGARDLYDIKHVQGQNIYIGQDGSPVRPREEKDLLARVRNRAESRLEGQLRLEGRLDSPKQPLDLDKQLQPAQVHSWRMEVKDRKGLLVEQLSPQTKMVEVFDRCRGQLLVLGEPGAGKTTSLIELALDLVSRADTNADRRIPVMVDLSDWQSQLPAKKLRKGAEESVDWTIADWLLTKIQEYSVQQIRQWLIDKRLVFLLDGLDEVQPEYQEKCIAALNDWLNSEWCSGEVVIACRRAQYENYQEKLKLQGAVYLQDLTDEQIKYFLNAINREWLWDEFVQDVELLDLVRKPLLLSMTISISEQREELFQQQEEASEPRSKLNLLLDAYVDRRLEQGAECESRFYRQGRVPSIEQSRKWLGILALNLLQESKNEFSIDQIQPSWLWSRSQMLLYITILASFLCLFGGVIGTCFSWDYRSSFYWGCILGLIWSAVEGYALWNGNPRIINSVESFSISMPNSLKEISSKVSAWKYEIIIVSIAPIASIPVMISLAVMNRGVVSLIYLMQIFTIFSLALVISISKDNAKKLKFHSGFNHSVKNSLENLIRITLLSFLFFLFEFGLERWTVSTLTEKKIFSLMSSPLFFCYASLLIWFLFGGGDTFFYHISLRLSLFLTRSIPWDYTKILDYNTELLLLQRVGGEYRFIHDLLRNSLAQAQIDKNSSSVNAQTHYRCGEAYRLSNRYFDALKSLNLAISLNPKYKDAIASRGEIYRLMGRYEEALKDFDLAIEIDPKYKDAIASRGITYRLTGRYEEALKDFDLAIEIDPKSRAIASRGQTYGLMKRYEEALKDFDIAIGIDPKSWAIASRGQTYRLMGRYEEALKDFDLAIGIDPKYEWAITSRGQTYRLMGRYEEALKDFDLAIGIDPKYEWAIFHRALVFLILKKNDLAQADLETVISFTQQQHTEKSNDCGIIFDLAIYNLAANRSDIAQDFYRSAIQQKASPATTRQALLELEELLKMPIKFPGAVQMKVELQQHLETK
jgi:tetratricopeptide (TPR) repeat protein